MKSDHDPVKARIELTVILGAVGFATICVTQSLKSHGMPVAAQAVGLAAGFAMGIYVGSRLHDMGLW